MFVFLFYLLNFSLVSRNQIVRLYSRFLSLDRQGFLKVLVKNNLKKFFHRPWLFGP